MLHMQRSQALPSCKKSVTAQCLLADLIGSSAGVVCPRPLILAGEATSCLQPLKRSRQEAANRDGGV